MSPFRRLNIWWVECWAPWKLPVAFVTSVDSMWIMFSCFLQLSIPEFQDLSCIFRQVGVYFTCSLLHRLAYFRRNFFSILTLLMKCCLNLSEDLSVVRVGVSFFSHSATWAEGCKVQCIRMFLLASYLFWPLSVALVILLLLRLHSRNDKCRFLILKQWGGSDCWRNLSRPWILQYGSTWRGGWAAVDQQLREERQSQGPQAPGGWPALLWLWFMDLQGGSDQGTVTPFCMRQGWPSGADVENHLFILCHSQGSWIQGFSREFGCKVLRWSLKIQSLLFIIQQWLICEERRKFDIQRLEFLMFFPPLSLLSIQE